MLRGARMAGLVKPQRDTGSACQRQVRAVPDMLACPEGRLCKDHKLRIPAVGDYRSGGRLSALTVEMCLMQHSLGWV